MRRSSFAFRLSGCWRPETSGLKQSDDSGCQGELLQVLVVLDVYVDRLPDDLRSFFSKLFEPLTVFFVIVLRFFLLPANQSALAPMMGSKKRGVQVSRPQEILEAKVSCLHVFVV